MANTLYWLLNNPPHHTTKDYANYPKKPTKTSQVNKQPNTTQQVRPPIETILTKPEATDDTSISKSKDDEANTHSSMSSTLSPTDDMSISTVPKHFTISAHTPYGNASDSSHDSEKSQPLPKQYPMNPAPQPHSNKTTPASEQNTSTVQDGPTMSPSLAHGHQFLLSVEIQLQPNKDHLDVMLYQTREILRYIQQVEPTAKFLSNSSPSCPTPPPPLVRPDDINWPHTYMTSTNWFHTSSKYLFQFPPIFEKQLTARLETRRNKKYESSITNKTKQKSNTQDDKGPTSMYTTLHLWSSLTTVDSLVDSINIDLRKSNIKVTIKTL
jgi:hypothetical protein